MSPDPRAALLAISRRASDLLAAHGEHHWADALTLGIRRLEGADPVAVPMLGETARSALASPALLLARDRGHPLSRAEQARANAELRSTLIELDALATALSEGDADAF